MIIIIIDLCCAVLSCAVLSCAVLSCAVLTLMHCLLISAGEPKHPMQVRHAGEVRRERCAAPVAVCLSGCCFDRLFLGVASLSKLVLLPAAAVYTARIRRSN